MSEERELYRTTATTQATWSESPVNIVEQLKQASEMLKRAQKIPTDIPDAIVITQKRFDTIPKGNHDVSATYYFGIPMHVVADDNAVALKLCELNHLSKVALIYDNIPHRIVDLKLLRESMGMP